MTEFTRRQRLINKLKEDIEDCKRVQKRMQELYKSDVETYSESDCRHIHAQFLALQARHEQTLSEYYNLVKPNY